MRNANASAITAAATKATFLIVNLTLLKKFQNKEPFEEDGNANQHRNGLPGRQAPASCLLILRSDLLHNYESKWVPIFWGWGLRICARQTLRFRELGLLFLWVFQTEQFISLVIGNLLCACNQLFSVDHG